jgi:hypothetical protein
MCVCSLTVTLRARIVAPESLSLEDERQKGKVVNLVTDDPRQSRTQKAVGTYSNFRVTKARAQYVQHVACVSALLSLCATVDGGGVAVQVTDPQLPSNADWREAGTRFMLQDGTASDSDDEPRRAARSK